MKVERKSNVDESLQRLESQSNSQSLIVLMG